MSPCLMGKPAAPFACDGSEPSLTHLLRLPSRITLLVGYSRLSQSDISARSLTPSIPASAIATISLPNAANTSLIILLPPTSSLNCSAFQSAHTLRHSLPDHAMRTPRRTLNRTIRSFGPLRTTNTLSSSCGDISLGSSDPGGGGLGYGKNPPRLVLSSCSDVGVFSLIRLAGFALLSADKEEIEEKGKYPRGWARRNLSRSGVRGWKR